MAHYLIGICGGIGSGKSVVSRLLRLMGHEVYDCDAGARRLMETDAVIKSRIRDEISADVTDGVAPPDRRLLASIVFSDEKMRQTLNSIVHCEVRKDVARHGDGCGVMFVEAAILAESGLAEMCDAIWHVEAPLGSREQRVRHRDGCSREAFVSRTESQRREAELLKRYEWKTVGIINDGVRPLLQQIGTLLDRLPQS